MTNWDSKIFYLKIIIIFGVITLVAIFGNKIDIAKELSKSYPQGDYHPVIFYLLHNGWDILYTKWDMLMRIDVMEKPETKEKFVIYDGKYELPFSEFNYKVGDGIVQTSDSLAPCFFRNYSSATILGVGTGNDIEILEEYDVKELYLVEINAGVVDLVKQKLKNHPYNRLDVKKMDGRKFIEATEKKFDLIALPFVDSPTAIININSENYLTTVEGFEEFLKHLNENGVLCLVHDENRVLNFYLLPFISALENLKENSNENILLMKREIYCKMCPYQGWYNRTYLIFSKSGFSPTEIELIKIHTFITYAPRKVEFFNAGEIQNSLLLKNPLPINDDRPYPNRLYFGLHQSEAEILILALLFGILFFSIAIFLARDLSFTFGSAFIGFSYMLLETVIIQKSLLLFATPPITIATVLLSFLLFNGIGAFLSNKIKRKKQLIFLLIILPSYILLFNMSLNLLKDTPFLHKNNFLMTSLFLISLSPLGILLGIPFPYLLSKVGERKIPVFYCLDAVFGVLGAVSGLPISIFFGFGTSFLIATIFYLMALGILVKKINFNL